MSYLALIVLLSMVVTLTWIALGITYRMGFRDGQQQMHWAHFDKGCYLDGNGEVYEHLRDEVQP